MSFAVLIVAAWIPLVTHPVKDPATHEMLRAVVTEPDPVAQELAGDALAVIEREQEESGKRKAESGNGTETEAEGEWPRIPRMDTNPDGENNGTLPSVPSVGGDEERVESDSPPPESQTLSRPNGGAGVGSLDRTDLLGLERAVRALAGDVPNGARTHLGRGAVQRAVEALLPLLEHADEGLRQATLETLLQLMPATNSAPVVAAIATRLTHEPSLRVCEVAGTVLVKTRTRAAQRALLVALQQESPLVRLAAVHALTAWRDDTTAPALHPLLSDPDIPVAVAAAAGLEKLANPDSQEPLLERLPGAPAAVQVAICHALGEFRMAAAADALQALFNEDPDSVSAAATEALTKLGDPAVIPLFRKPLQRVTASAGGTRREALKGLRLLGDTESGALAWKLATQRVVPTPLGPVLDSQDVREEGLRYMAATGDRRYAKALIDIAGNQDAQMEAIAVEAVKTIAAVGEPAQLMEFLAGLANTPSAKDRPTLCEILWTTTEVRYEPLPDETHRRYFVESLGPLPYRSVPEPPGVVARNAELSE